VGEWWQRNIAEPGKAPLLLCLFAFVLTFLITRTIVRLIRAGRGPFRNVSAGGMHVHHVVPGTILVILGGLMALGAAGSGAWRIAAGVVFGIGAALVLDEFALILHLSDVYWSQAGRASVNAVLLTAGIMGCVLLGFSPLGVDNVHHQEWTVRTEVTLNAAVSLLFVAIALLKGKYGMALLGVFVLPLAAIASVRLARPNSPWDHWFYRPTSAKATRAAHREALSPPLVVRVRGKVENLLAGAPTVTAPAVTALTGAGCAGTAPGSSAPPTDHSVGG
jgi:ABC-type multidrug transport system fused ATPase/permease subunit